MADGFIAKAETRAEKLGNSLGMRVAVFYFMPFLITVLVVGVSLIKTIIGTLQRVYPRRDYHGGCSIERKGEDKVSSVPFTDCRIMICK